MNIIDKHKLHVYKLPILVRPLLALVNMRYRIHPILFYMYTYLRSMWPAWRKPPARPTAAEDRSSTMPAWSAAKQRAGEILAYTKHDNIKILKQLCQSFENHNLKQQVCNTKTKD